MKAKYVLYHNGMARAQVCFTQTKILARVRNLRNGAFESEKSLEETTELKLQFPLDAIHRRWLEYPSLLDGHHSTFVDEQGIVYERHSTSTEAVAWLQMTGSDPLDILVRGSCIIALIQHSRLGQTVLVAPGSEAHTPLEQWRSTDVSAADQGIMCLGRQDMMTRDGLRLAAEVWLPSKRTPDEQFPTVLIRTPYGRMNNSHAFTHFVDRGYALVIQDTRGRHDSEGDFSPNIYEKDDGDDTLHWIAQQAWSNGKVGMIGSSYGGFVQWAASASGNPHLQAIVSRVTSGTPFFDIPIRGGALLSGMLAWSFIVSERVTDGSKAERTDWSDVLRMRPLRDIPSKALGHSIPFWEEWLEHPNYDAYWQNADWTRDGSRSEIPALIISGWYDDDSIGTSQAWQMVTQQRRCQQRLILGPWKHKFNTTREIHEVEFGRDAIRYDLELLYLRWFDQHLKGLDTGLDDESPVQYFSVGDNTWVEADMWPPQEARLEAMYLHSDGHAADKGGQLSAIIPDGVQPRDPYRYDPSCPAPHIIDMSENELHVPENYCEMEARKDVLVYTSAVLNEPLVLAGEGHVVLYAASDRPDTDWVVRLTDVHPDGRSIRLCDGLIRARYRNSFSEPELLVPGELVEYSIPLGKVGCTIAAGHQLRLQVTSSAENLIFPNPNVAGDPNEESQSVPAQQEIAHDASYPSRVLLPIVEGKLP